jgi:RNA 3'-terminal phosphate cyclase (ATP)
LADYVIHVLCPNLRSFGVILECLVLRDGFFPRGGGELSVSCRKDESLDRDELEGTVSLRSVKFPKRGRIAAVRGRVVIAGSAKDEVGVSMVMAAKKVLRRRLGTEAVYSGSIEIELDRVAPRNCANGTVAAITLWAATEESATASSTVLGASGIGDRKLAPECAAVKAANELADAIESGSAVDSHMADQLPIFMATAKGESRMVISEPSLHTKTVVGVLQQFGVDCVIEPLPGSTNLHTLMCKGLGIGLEP